MSSLSQNEEIFGPDFALAINSVADFTKANQNPSMKEKIPLAPLATAHLRGSILFLGAQWTHRNNTGEEVGVCNKKGNQQKLSTPFVDGSTFPS